MSLLAPPPSSLAQYAMMRGAMGAIATWIFMPSLLATLVAGLLAIGVNSAFHNAAWAWVKLATGILVFEGGLVGVKGRMQEEAERSAAALAGQVASISDPATLAGSLNAERNVLWVLLAVATANVVLGIWRPRFTRVGARTLLPHPRYGGAFASLPVTPLPACGYGMHTSRMLGICLAARDPSPRLRRKRGEVR